MKRTLTVLLLTALGVLPAVADSAADTAADTRIRAGYERPHTKALPEQMPIFVDAVKKVPAEIRAGQVKP
jgi:hypothetical protein